MLTLRVVTPSASVTFCGAAPCWIAKPALTKTKSEIVRCAVPVTRRPIAALKLMSTGVPPVGTASFVAASCVKSIAAPLEAVFICTSSVPPMSKPLMPTSDAVPRARTAKYLTPPAVVAETRPTLRPANETPIAEVVP